MCTYIYLDTYVDLYTTPSNCCVHGSLVVCWHHCSLHGADCMTLYILWWICISLFSVKAESSSVHFLMWLAATCWITTLNFGSTSSNFTASMGLRSISSRGCSKPLKPQPLVLPHVFVMLVTRPLLWPLSISSLVGKKMGFLGILVRLMSN